MIKGSAKSMMIRGLKCAPVTEGGGVMWSCHGRLRSDNSDVTRPPATVTTSAVTPSDPRHTTTALPR